MDGEFEIVDSQNEGSHAGTSQNALESIQATAGVSLSGSEQAIYLILQ